WLFPLPKSQFCQIPPTLKFFIALYTAVVSSTKEPLTHLKDSSTSQLKANLITMAFCNVSMLVQTGLSMAGQGICKISKSSTYLSTYPLPTSEWFAREP